MCCCCCCDCVLVLIALVFPPFPVWMKTGLCSADSWINIALCFLGYLPGVLHSLYIIAKYPIQYVVIDTEAQIYRPVSAASNERHYHHHNHPTTVIRERVETPTNEQLISYENPGSYGSTNNQPPPYSELPGPSK